MVAVDTSYVETRQENNKEDNYDVQQDARAGTQGEVV